MRIYRKRNEEIILLWQCRISQKHNGHMEKTDSLYYAGKDGLSNNENLVFIKFLIYICQKSFAEFAGKR